MAIFEYLLLVVLLIAAVCIVVAVVFQKTGEDGLSSTLAGGQETYYGKDKGSNTDRALFKWTMYAAIVFVAVTLIVYIIQPDYAQSIDLDGWKDLTNFSGIFQ